MAVETIKILINAETKQAERSLSGLAKTAQRVFTAIIANQVAQAGIEMAKFAATAEGIERSYALVTASAGLFADKLQTDLHNAAGGTISDLELMRIANTALVGASRETQQMLGESLPQILEIARASARATGADFQWVFSTLVDGIRKGSPMLIDNARLQIKAGEAAEEYARKVGKSVGDLTAQERTQATLNAVLKDGAYLVESLGGSVDDAWAPMNRFNVAWEEWRLMMGEAALPAMSMMAERATEAMKAIDSKQVREFSAAMMELAESVHVASGAIEGLGLNTMLGGATKAIQVVTSLRRGLNDLAESKIFGYEMPPFIQEMIRTANPFRAVVAQVSGSFMDMKDNLEDVAPMFGVELPWAVGEATDAASVMGGAWEEAAPRMGAAADAMAQKAEESATKQAAAFREFQSKAHGIWLETQQDQTDLFRDYARRREDITESHLDRLASLAEQAAEVESRALESRQQAEQDFADRRAEIAANAQEQMVEAEQALHARLQEIDDQYHESAAQEEQSYQERRQELIDSVQERLTELEAKYQQDVQDAVEEHAQATARLEEEIQKGRAETQEKYLEKMAAAEKKYQQQVADLMSDYQDKMADMEWDAQRRRDEMARSFAVEQEKIGDKFGDKRNAVEERYGEQRAGIAEEYNAYIANLNQVHDAELIAALEKERDAKLSRIDEARQSELDLLEQQEREELAKLQQAQEEKLRLFEAEYQHRKEIEEREHQQKLARLERQRQEEETKAAEARDKSLADLNEKYTTEQARLDQHLAEELVRLGQAYEAERQKQAAALAKRLAQLDQHHQQTMQRLEAQRAKERALAEKRYEEQQRKQAESLAKQMAALEKSHAEELQKIDERTAKELAELAKRRQKENEHYQEQLQDLTTWYMDEKQALNNHLDEKRKLQEEYWGQLGEEHQAWVDEWLTQEARRQAGPTTTSGGVGSLPWAGTQGIPPSFQGGGIVPGPIGMPVPATVHGGEKITPPGQSGGTFNITVNLVGGGGAPYAQGEAMGRGIYDELMRRGLA